MNETQNSALKQILSLYVMALYLSCFVSFIILGSGLNILYKIILETVPFYSVCFEIFYEVLGLAIPWKRERTYL